MSIVLATGGLGYIGSHTCIRLIEEGNDVVILDSLFNSSIKVLERIEKVESRFMQPQQSQADPGWGVTSGNGGARKRKAQ